jgi:hypothetical protein
MFLSNSDQVPGADYIVAHSFDNMCLHHWHVLVCCGVIYRVYRVGTHDFIDRAIIPNITNLRDDFNTRMPLPQLLVNFEKLALRLIQQNELSWNEGGDLPAQLRPNGAGGARDHN